MTKTPRPTGAKNRSQAKGTVQADAAFAAAPVYLAGPMFSHADVTQQLMLAGHLDAAGLNTYLPQRDGIEVAKVMHAINVPLFDDPLVIIEVMEFARKLVFALDVYQVLERCQAVVLNLDGRVPDEGSVMEAALAWAADRPVVVFKTTAITMLGGYDNPMVSGLSMKWRYIDAVEDLPSEVAKAIASRHTSGTLPTSPANQFVAGGHPEAVIALGRAVWDRIGLIGTITNLDPTKIPAAVRALKKDLKRWLEPANLFT